jgi:hypothetical protein
MDVVLNAFTASSLNFSEDTQREIAETVASNLSDKIESMIDNDEGVYLQSGYLPNRKCWFVASVEVAEDEMPLVHVCMESTKAANEKIYALFEHKANQEYGDASASSSGHCSATVH